MSGFRYACLYWRHHSKQVDFDDDLVDLVELDEYANDRGERSTVGFYELTADGWVPVDVHEIVAKVRAEEKAEWAERSRNAQRKPWRLIILGPEGVASHWSRHRTKREALEAGSALPNGLAWDVKKATA